MDKKEDNQEEMNNKFNEVKAANCVNKGYEFPEEEVDYEEIVLKEDKEGLTTNNKDSPNEQLASQVEVPKKKPEWPDPESL